MSKASREDLLKCPVLTENRRKLTANSVGFDVKNYDLTVTGMDNLPEELLALKLYENHFDKIATKYALPDSTHGLTKNYLELAAMMYVGLCAKKEFQGQIGIIAEHLKKVEKVAVQLEQLLEPGRDTWRDIYKIYPAIDKAEVDIDDLLNTSLANLKQLKELRAQFLEYKMTKMAEYGKKAPLGNAGLEIWVKVLLGAWWDVLKRTLDNQNDGINGRSHLVHFMCDCMEVVHPALEYDTIDNMLRKVQNGLKNGAEQLIPK